MQHKWVMMGLLYFTYVHKCVVSHMWNFLRRCVERGNIIDYILNGVNQIIINNNKIRIDTNHSQENYLGETSVTIISNLGGDGSTTTGVAGWILLAGILTESEYSRTVNTHTHNNDKIVQIVDVIDSDS